TQCMDACDEIMTKIKKPKGLIRYSCQDGIDGKPLKGSRPRLIVYPVLLAIVVSAFFITLAYRAPVDVTVLRNLGNPFVVTPDGNVQNSFKLKLVNREQGPLDVKITVL